MNRGLAAAVSCCALALAGGCGSSSGVSSSSPTTSSGGTTATSGKTTSTPSAALKVDTTPKFASPSPSAPIQSGVVQIAYRNITIVPDTVRVKLGSTIKWTNYDSTKANVVSEGGPQQFASKDFGEGGTFEIKVEKLGVIHYECTLYPATMNGTIEIVS